MANKIIKCACGETFENKKDFIIHILKLGCFDENLNWKNAEEKDGE